MIPAFRNLPLSARLLLMGAMFLFNYLLFPTVAALFVLPFYGMDKLTGVLNGKFVTETDKYIFLFVQGAASLGAFGFTSLLMSQLETRFVVKRLALGIRPGLKLILIAVFSIIAAQAFIQFLVEINQKIPLPTALNFLAEQGKHEEEIMQALMKGSSFKLFLCNSVVLAMVPAIGEELFFRGLILGELLKARISPIVAILVTGFLFSIAHAEYDNVLAIWVLGSFLGYLYYVSGSLWLSVIAHFTNNFLLILLKYLYNIGFIKADIAEADMPLYATLVSIVLFLLCLFALNKWRRPVDFELGDPELINEENYSE